MKFQGKNIGILGLGKSGYWSAKLAKSLKNNVFVSDSNTNVNEMFVDDLKMLGIDVEIGIHSNQILESDLIIKSPGIPNDSEIMNKINSEKIPVISEIEFAGNHSKTKNNCITGTNGKTTKVSLLTEIDYCILELSSFQLEHCSKLKKEISVILNISLDHMDRYNSFEDYFETKIKIFENAKYCLFNYDDNFLNERIKSNDKNIIPFSISEEKGYYYYDTNKILSNGNSISIDIEDISLKGIHNVSNIIIAAEIAKKVGIDQKNICRAVREFEGLEHRFEHFISYNGIDFINDSKSTNIDSAKKALESISGKVILILGGIPKEDDFSDISLFKKSILKIVVYGEASHKIYNSLPKDISLERIKKFEDAVQVAIESAVENSVVLLSPACASFDQFDNYKERGKKFKNIVERFYA